MTRRLSRETAAEAGLLSDAGPARRSAAADCPLIVHLGFGAFARAHTAVFTEEANRGAQQLDEPSWRIVGVTQRSRAVADQLDPQDGLFSVVEQDRDTTDVQLITCVEEVLSGPDQADEVVQRIADPRTRIVSLTVTEKGYRLDPSQETVDLTDPEVRADLDGGGPSTPIGQIVAGLRRRAETGAGPLTVLSCDNLPGNGALTRRAVRTFIGALPDGETSRELLDWLDQHVTFPSTMVDRMVPQPTAETAELARGALGLQDEGAVPSESFRQWVLEDSFAAGRPRWERAGATFGDDVAAWEETKLRILNAGHSLLAYLGRYAGLSTICEAAEDEVWAAACRELYRADVLPVLETPGDVDGAAYADSVLRRFANPALGHTTAKVGSDGSQKLGPRFGTTVRRSMERGAVPQWAALAVAGWVHDILEAPSLGATDPAAERLRRRASGEHGTARAVEVVLDEAGLFQDVADRGRFVHAAAEWLELMQDDADMVRQEIPARIGKETSDG